VRGTEQATLLSVTLCRQEFGEPAQVLLILILGQLGLLIFCVLGGLEFGCPPDLVLVVAAAMQVATGFVLALGVSMSYYVWCQKRGS
jgi:hypothetical protein